MKKDTCTNASETVPQTLPYIVLWDISTVIAQQFCCGGSG
jgi:hypothetical protein